MEDSDCKDIIQRSGMGICCSPDDAVDIAAKLLDLIHHPEKLKGMKPDEDYIHEFSFRNKTAELAAVFRKLSQGIE